MRSATTSGLGFSRSFKFFSAIDQRSTPQPCVLGSTGVIKGMPKTAFRIYQGVRACDQVGCWTAWPCATHPSARAGEQISMNEKPCVGCGYCKCSCVRAEEPAKSDPIELPGWVRNHKAEVDLIQLRALRKLPAVSILIYELWPKTKEHWACRLKVFVSQNKWVFTLRRPGKSPLFYNFNDKNSALEFMSSLAAGLLWR